MKYIITESQYNILLTEQKSSDLYSAVLGYLAQYGEEIMNSAKDKLRMLQAKKEVMIFCENKRDGKPTIKFSLPESTALFKTTLKMVKNNPNIASLISRGKNIKHT
jgi:hypothetical protein